MRRFQFRFKVIDQYGYIVSRGLCCNVLHSEKWLFEYVQDGRVKDSIKTSINDFAQKAFDMQCDLVFEPTFNADSVPYNHHTVNYYA